MTTARSVCRAPRDAAARVYTIFLPLRGTDAPEGIAEDYATQDVARYALGGVQISTFTFNGLLRCVSYDSVNLFQIEVVWCVSLFVVWLAATRYFVPFPP